MITKEHYFWHKGTLFFIKKWRYFGHKRKHNTYVWKLFAEMHFQKLHFHCNTSSWVFHFLLVLIVFIEPQNHHIHITEVKMCTFHPPNSTMQHVPKPEAEALPEECVKCPKWSTYREVAWCYVTLITGLEFDDESWLPLPLSLLMHCPVNWFTLRGLLMSWGLVPTGFRCNGGPGGGWWGGWWWCDKLFRGGLHSKEADADSWGVRGLCKLIQGLARLTEGLAKLVLGLGKIIDGDVRLERPLNPPGLESECGRLSPSSSGGVCASPTLPQLPKLSSDWFPSTLSPDSI